MLQFWLKALVKEVINKFRAETFQDTDKTKEIFG